MRNVKSIIDMKYHRNGVSGAGAIVTLFRAYGSRGTFLATTVFPDRPHNPVLQVFIDRDGIEQAYVDAAINDFAVHTVVVNLDSPTEKWRGADTWGREIALAYRERSMSGELFGDEGGSDPFLERFHEEHPTPEQVASLKQAIADNDRLVAEFFGV